MELHSTLIHLLGYPLPPLQMSYVHAPCVGGGVALFMTCPCSLPPSVPRRRPPVWASSSSAAAAAEMTFPEIRTTSE